MKEGAVIVEKVNVIGNAYISKWNLFLLLIGIAKIQFLGRAEYEFPNLKIITEIEIIK